MGDILILYRGNDMVIEFAPGNFLTDAITDQPVAEATVDVQLLDKAGAPIAGFDPPVSMPDVSGEAGNYRATIEDATSLNAVKFAKVTAEKDGSKAVWERRVTVTTRR